MVTDQTEGIRRELQGAINAEEAERAALEAKHGQVWDPSELREAFTVESFFAPLVVATRKADGVRGYLFFQHNPRFYFGWNGDK